LPELLASVVFAVGSAELLGDTTCILSRAAKSAGDVTEEIKLSVPSQRNQAKQMAYSLVDKLPLLLGNEATESVPRRFKNESTRMARHLPSTICCQRHIITTLRDQAN
jgi:hypothetical protein